MVLAAEMGTYGQPAGQVWEGLSHGFLWVSCCSTRSSRISPEFHRNFTRCSPAFRRNIELEHLNKGDSRNSAFPQGHAVTTRLVDSEAHRHLRIQRVFPGIDTHIIYSYITCMYVCMYVYIYIYI